MWPDSCLLLQEEELETVKAMGNVKTNESYERYIPTTWSKPTPDADHKVIQRWIRAKYEKHHFMVPHYKEVCLSASYLCC
jgi:Putative GTPase activating protein for Arf